MMKYLPFGCVYPSSVDVGLGPIFVYAHALHIILVVDVKPHTAGITPLSRSSTVMFLLIVVAVVVVVADELSQLYCGKNKKNSAITLIGLLNPLTLLRVADC